MNSDHDRIREMLPQYVRGAVSAENSEEIMAHLAVCADCRDEAALVKDMASQRVPDPGEAYWTVLRSEVRRQTRRPADEHKPWGKRLFSLLRPVPVAAFAIAALIIVLSTVGRDQPQDPAHPFSDPLVVSVLDYEYLDEADLAVSEIAGGEDESPFAGTVYGRGYYADIASLDAEQMDELLALLKTIENQGG